MKSSVQSIITLVFGYFIELRRRLPQNETFGMPWKEKLQFNSHYFKIHVVNCFDAVLNPISNLSAISSSSKPKRNRTKTANISSSKSSFLFQPLLHSSRTRFASLFPVHMLMLSIFGFSKVKSAIKTAKDGKPV